MEKFGPEIENPSDAVAVLESEESKEWLEKFGRLISKADSYDLITNDDVHVDVQQQIYQSVWPVASELRRSGELLQFGSKIQCPVVAIHGDYDPHPAEGVKEPLSKVLKDFRFTLLNNCGHKPWIENQAKEQFFRILKVGISNKPGFSL